MKKVHRNLRVQATAAAQTFIFFSRDVSRDDVPAAKGRAREGLIDECHTRVYGDRRCTREFFAKTTLRTERGPKGGILMHYVFAPSRKAVTLRKLLGARDDRNHCM